MKAMEEPLWGAGIFGTQPEKNDFSEAAVLGYAHLCENRL